MSEDETPTNDESPDNRAEELAETAQKMLGGSISGGLNYRKGRMAASIKPKPQPATEIIHENQHLPSGEIPPHGASQPAALLPPNPAMGQRGILIRGLQELTSFASLIVRSGLAPANTSTEAVAVIIQYGLEIGLPPLTALQTLYVPKGSNRVGASTKGLLALAQSHKAWMGMEEHVEEEDGGRYKATCTVKRKGCPDLTESYSTDDAEREGLAHKDNWRKMPRTMCVARARSRALSAQFSDAILGLYDSSELSDSVTPELP